ncbi:MAG: PIG-L family deacetylase [Candidatus Dadabacteria bacterium]|nr:PIG-L family deacetylase [Candidatus Dadabacteria bacterium]
MSDNVLVISPHPDDLEIGMGGTVAKFTESGVNVVSMVVTDGRRSTSLYGLSEDEMVELRASEVRSATAVLGIGYLILLGLGDLRSAENGISFVTALKEAVKRFSPREIYMPHPEIPHTGRYPPRPSKLSGEWTGAFYRKGSESGVMKYGRRCLPTTELRTYPFRCT